MPPLATDRRPAARRRAFRRAAFMPATTSGGDSAARYIVGLAIWAGRYHVVSMDRKSSTASDDIEHPQFATDRSEWPLPTPFVEVRLRVLNDGS